MITIFSIAAAWLLASLLVGLVVGAAIRNHTQVN